MNSPLIKSLIWLTIFSIAMGYLESAVVVYLRELYYPAGFRFPLNPMGKDIVTTEFWREIATIIMLLGVAILAGKNAVQRLAFFIISFALWDIFYYVFLYVLLGWPPSLLTWDILFLVPVPWVGPVLSVLIITILMTIHACLMVFFDKSGTDARVDMKEWLLLVTGSILVILSWTRDYFNYLRINNPDTSLWSLYSKDALFEEPQKYVPQSFNWLLYAGGTLVLLIAIGSYYFRNRKHFNQNSVQ